MHQKAIKVLFHIQGSYSLRFFSFVKYLYCISKCSYVDRLQDRKHYYLCAFTFSRDSNFPVIENSMGASVSSFNEGTNNAENQQAKGAISSDQREKKPGKAASLQKQYPSSANGCRLEILVQPEHQHRARYLTEGSRGPVKDRSQQGFPQLQVMLSLIINMI